MNTFVVDTYEGRDVAIFDVPGASFTADMPYKKNVSLKLGGEFMDIHCDVNLYHIQNTGYKNGKMVLCLRIMEAPYRCIELTLLWYELYANTLKELVFVINKYDQFVANKIIDWKEMHCLMVCRLQQDVPH